MFYNIHNSLHQLMMHKGQVISKKHIWWPLTLNILNCLADFVIFICNVETYVYTKFSFVGIFPTVRLFSSNLTGLCNLNMGSNQDTSSISDRMNLAIIDTNILKYMKNPNGKKGKICNCCLLIVTGRETELIWVSVIKISI